MCLTTQKRSTYYSGIKIDISLRSKCVQLNKKSGIKND